MQAQDAKLVGVKFHTTEWDPTRASTVGFGNESLIAELTATWNGKPVSFDMRATRYVPSDNRWTEWRVYVDDRRGSGFTERAAQALGEAGEPLVRRFLESDDFAVSRRKALAYMVKGLVQEDARYGASTVRSTEAMLRVGAELDHNDMIALSDAVDALAHYLNIMEGIPT